VTRVLIAATSKIVRVELASLLAAKPGFKVVANLPIETALMQLEDLHPDVVILDLESTADETMPLTFELAEMLAGPALVILTDNSENLFSIDTLRSSARAMLPRDAKAEEIFAAIHATLAGLVVLDRNFFNLILPLTGGGQQTGLDASDQILTPREIEVLRMIAEGLGNKEIASKLGISDHTVKFHTGSIFAKLGASNRAEAVTLGIREGLIMV
jgi:NarL family two-component system response regulator YdfI